MAFAPFKKLPPEIRCQIWHHASATEPRIVPIHYDPGTTSYKPRVRPPAVLQATRESRHEALKIYHELRLGLVTNAGCYINPLCDAIYLNSNLSRVTNRIDHSTNIEPWQRGRLITTSPVAGDASVPSAENSQSTQSIQSTQTDQSVTSDPSDIEASNSTTPNPDMLRSRRHSKIILDDLIHSPDAEIIFKNFYVNFKTWDLVRRYHRHRRHKIPCLLKQLNLIFEETGSAPLRSDFELRDLGPQEQLPEGDPRRPVDYELRRNSYKLACSLRASNSFVNYRDKKQGRPIVLNYRVFAKSIYLGELSPLQF